MNVYIQYAHIYYIYIYIIHGTWWGSGGPAQGTMDICMVPHRDMQRASFRTRPHNIFWYGLLNVL